MLVANCSSTKPIGSDCKLRRSINAMVTLFAMLFLLMASVAGHAQETAIILEIEGPIGPPTAEYVERGLRTAHDSDSVAVVLRLDTPGGLDTSMRARDSGKGVSGGAGSLVVCLSEAQGDLCKGADSEDNSLLSTRLRLRP